MLVLKATVLATVATVSIAVAVTFPQHIERLQPYVTHSLPQTLLRYLHRPQPRLHPLPRIPPPPQVQRELQHRAPPPPQFEREELRQRAPPPPQFEREELRQRAPSPPQFEREELRQRDPSPPQFDRELHQRPPPPSQQRQREEHERAHPPTERQRELRPRAPSHSEHRQEVKERAPEPSEHQLQERPPQLSEHQREINERPSSTENLRQFLQEQDHARQKEEQQRARQENTERFHDTAPPRREFSSESHRERSEDERRQREKKVYKELPTKPKFEQITTVSLNPNFRELKSPKISEEIKTIKKKPTRLSPKPQPSPVKSTKKEKKHALIRLHEAISPEQQQALIVQQGQQLANSAAAQLSGGQIHGGLILSDDIHTEHGISPHRASLHAEQAFQPHDFAHPGQEIRGIHSGSQIVHPGFEGTEGGGSQRGIHGGESLLGGEVYHGSETFHGGQSFHGGESFHGGQSFHGGGGDQILFQEHEIHPQEVVHSEGPIHVPHLSSGGYEPPHHGGSLNSFGSGSHHAPAHHGYQPKYPHRPAQYDFSYAVKDEYGGNDFGHREVRQGDDTKGAYYVQLPDGRRQTVNYSVQKGSGYVADVHYDGKAVYPPPRPYHGGGGGGHGGYDGGHQGGGHDGGHHGGIGVNHHGSGGGSKFFGGSPSSKVFHGSDNRIVVDDSDESGGLHRPRGEEQPYRETLFRHPGPQYH